MIKYKDLTISFSNIRSLSIQSFELDLPEEYLSTKILYDNFSKEGYLIVVATRNDHLVSFAVFDMINAGLVSYYANRSEEYLLPQLLRLVKASFEVKRLGTSVFNVKHVEEEKHYNKKGSLMRKGR